MKILLIDSHPAIQMGLGEMLVDRFKCQIVGVSTMDDLATAVQSPDFDLVISDVKLDGSDTYPTLSGLTEPLSRRIVVYTAMDNPTFIARGIAYGIFDYVLKSDSVERLYDAIERAMDEKGPDVDGHLVRIRQMVEDRRNDLPSEFPLTERESQVLRHLGLGLSNREIASSLVISVETVKEHVQNILRKINATDRTDAAVKAVRSGIV